MSFIRWIPLAIVAAAMLVIAGCGSDGAQGPAGPPGQDAVSTSTALETCAVCHADGTLVDIDIANGTHTPVAATTQWDVSITSVDTTGDNVKVTVHIELAGGTTAVTTAGLSDIRFMYAQLVPGADVGVGETNRWQSHYLRYDNAVPTYIRGDDSTMTPDVTGSGSGNYVFTLGVGLGSGTTHRGKVEETVVTGGSLDLTNLATYDATYTQRIGVQVSNGVSNAVVDWTPGAAGVQVLTGQIQEGVDTAGTMANEVVKTESCNECHGAGGTTGLGFHGNTRREVEYCVTCHNPGIAGAVPADQQFEFKQMIHKIHMGKNLPSVQAGATTVLGDAGFAKGGFPQPIENCAKCHDNGVAADADNWIDVPTIESCGACHDTVNFTTGTGHAGGAEPTNENCSGCHNSSRTDLRNPELAHRWAAVVADAVNWEYQINAGATSYDSDTGVLTINFQVETPVGSPSSLTSSAWTQGSASRLFLNVGWKAIGKADYTNPGANESAPGSALDIPIVNNGALQAGVTDTGGFVYEVSVTLPAEAQAAGTAIIFMDGHPAKNLVPGEAALFDRIPVKNALLEFAINDSSPDMRRQVVSNNLSKCVTCHDTLSIHGENRQGDMRVCTTCHNSANTDIERRPASGAVDGKAEESVDMKYLIHRIHRGRDSLAGGITVYGFSSANVFAGEYPRGALLNSCETCHVTTAGGNYKPPLADGMEGTTIDSGSVGHTDDLNISPTAAVCSGCHDSNIAKGHMTLMGGSFSVLEENTIY
jgi:OmcA/MtrC family decaheme c-type cytochrome